MHDAHLQKIAMHGALGIFSMRGTRQTPVHDARHGGRGGTQTTIDIFTFSKCPCYANDYYLDISTATLFQLINSMHTIGQYIIESLRRQLYVPLESPQP